MPEPIYRGPLEYVVSNVLQVAQEHFVRTGKPPKPQDSASVMSEILEMLPPGSLRAPNALHPIDPVNLSGGGLARVDENGSVQLTVPSGRLSRPEATRLRDWLARALDEH